MSSGESIFFFETAVSTLLGNAGSCYFKVIEDIYLTKVLSICLPANTAPMAECYNHTRC